MSIFNKIINGEIPSYKVAEDENYLAFLDINPLALGHTLIIPKVEVDYIFDLDSETFLGLWAFAQKVAKAIDKVVICQKVGIAVIGLEVRHAHIHLIPLQTGLDIDFSRPKLLLEESQFLNLVSKIQTELK